MSVAIDWLEQARHCMPTILAEKYGEAAQAGWGPRQRAAFGYHTPADWYEALLDAMVTPDTKWLDVGCGRDLAPRNPATSRRLSARCELLVGLDPSDNIDDNEFVHRRLKMTIEQHPPGEAYDLITLRMVAEHIESPQAVVSRLAGLLRPGGRIVIHTVWQYSPSVFVSAHTPLFVHHAVKRVLWNTEERDTFPTVYLMNNRTVLTRLSSGAGLQEELFALLDDCRSTARFRLPQYAELLAWKALSALSLRYPESCILAVYRRA